MYLPGKIVLEGTVPQRLDQLDKRETELLEDISKQRSINKRLKEDRGHYRKKCDEKELVIYVYIDKLPQVKCRS